MNRYEFGSIESLREYMDDICFMNCVVSKLQTKKFVLISSISAYNGTDTYLNWK